MIPVSRRNAIAASPISQTILMEGPLHDKHSAAHEGVTQPIQRIFKTRVSFGTHRPNLITREIHQLWARPTLIKRLFSFSIMPIRGSIICGASSPSSTRSNCIVRSAESPTN